MSDGDALLGAVDDRGIRELALNRPDKANALNAGIVRRLHALLDEIGDETRVLVVKGAGRHFCGGFDFEGVEAQSEGDLVLRFVQINELLARLRRAPYLTVAWVRGAAFGAGADIVCACAWRYGAARARFRFPGFQFGVALGTRRLAELIGAQRAREVLAGNQTLDATAAHAAGLLSEVIDEADFETRLATLDAATAGLDRAARRALLRVTAGADHDADLADLVRSVARPGIHERIARYRQATAA
ncbi:MAG: enoyl-CoA hydratase/isomerase family protein [Proteobacteria bacterium]|nr:enoyl-CoA hydratase/isomerase family protein [Pseudomonadota bacterium]